MEHRRRTRFTLQLPLNITRSHMDHVEFAGVTRNISSSGVLFTAARGPELGGPIEYVIALPNDGAQIVQLRCLGKVVRAERVGPGSYEEPPTYQIAATLERYEFVREE